ncbi:MAG TPA: glycosyltransferase family 4 protein [Acidimicrobiales bacterium]|nr:glycosyltransferase family 4 protein [Acidimicrobiales bacterium]
MRILTVANHLGARGGLERTQLTTCRALAERGHRVDLVYVSAGDFEADWRSFAGSMVQIAGTLPRRAAPIRSATGTARALAAARRLRPEVVYVYRYWDLPMAALVRGPARRPVVFHCCLPPPVPMPRWLRWSLGRVDTTVAVSSDTAARWQGSGLDPSRVEVVLTGIDSDYFRPVDATQRSKLRRALGTSDDAFLVVFTGRISREKGVDVLVQACRALADRLPDLQLVVVGGPSLGSDPADSDRYRAELERMAGDLRVEWLGARPDVRPVLAAADVAVVPSLWPEPLSRAVMEPLACGIPVVGSRVGGTPELLSGWLERFLCAPGDPAALAVTLEGLHDWRAREPDLGRRCRAAAVEHLSLRRETDAVEAALRRTTRESVGSSTPA